MDWEILQLNNQGFGVAVFHLGGTGYVSPSAHLELDVNDMPRFLVRNSAVYYANENHFSVAQLVAGAVEGPLINWEAQLNNKITQRAQTSQLSETDFCFFTVASGKQLTLRLEELGDKFVVKPLDGTGGSQNVRVFSAAQAAEAVRHVDAYVTGGGLMIAESYLDGVEICHDGFVRQGVVKTFGVGRYAQTNEHPEICLGILYSDEISAELLGLVQLETERILGALEYVQGPFHIEYKLGTFGLQLIEAHGRLGGSVLPEALHRLNGYSAFQCITDGAPMFDREPQAVVIVDFVYGRRPGTFSSRGRKHLVSADNGSLYMFLSEEISGAPEGDEILRVGYLATSGKTVGDALETRDRRLAPFRYEAEIASELIFDWSSVDTATRGD